MTALERMWRIFTYGRCRSRSPGGHRCRRWIGHGSWHRRGSVEWFSSTVEGHGRGNSSFPPPPAGLR